MAAATLTPCEGEVLFHRTVQVRPYEVAKSEIRLPFRFDPEDDAVVILAKAEQVDTAAKAYVYGSLGLDTAIEDGKLVEVVASQFPGSQIIDPTDKPSLATVPEASDGDAEPPHTPLTKRRNEMSEVEKAMDKENRTWAEGRLRTHPNEFHDNRAEKTAPGGNAKWPDFKHKTSGIAVWADS